MVKSETKKLTSDGVGNKKDISDEQGFLLATKIDRRL